MNQRSNRESHLELILQVIIDSDKYYAEAKSFEDYMERIHQLLGKLMYVNNFYIAIYEPSNNTISYPYNVDEVDGSLPVDQQFTLASSEQSPTAWVISHKKKLVMRMSDEPRNNEEGEIWGVGTRAEHWVGVPLIARRGNCLGAMVVQSYKPEISFSDEDIAIFKLFSSIVASAIEKHGEESKLQSTIDIRTSELEKELLEKKRAEKLQKALYQIAELSKESISLDLLFKRIHEIVNTLIYAKNLFIATCNEEQTELLLAYDVDEKDSVSRLGTTFPIGKGLSSYVLKKRKPQLLTPEIVRNLVSNGEDIEALGALDYKCWLGAPLISANMLHGIIVVQSYDEKIMFSEADLEVLHFVAHHVAKAIEANINTQQRKEAQLKLAKQHRILEEQHKEQNEMLQKLQRTQQKLVQKEKMASLGGLVAGIAHEINTPLGICVTGISHLLEEYRFAKKALADNTMTEEHLLDFFEEVKETGDILTTNTKRAADLVQSFKQVAVDQSSNSIREIDLCKYIHEVILSMRPTLKRVAHEITVQCDENIIIHANAGAISQIITNLIMNSIKHGFENIDKGHIMINAMVKNNNIVLRYADDGNGISTEDMKKLFEPFFTTKRGDGGSGLGTHLIYNLVTSALNGRVEAKSELGKGLAYMIKFPINSDE